MYLITTPSQKYDTPDLTYVRTEVAKKATLKKSFPLFNVASTGNKIKTPSSESQFNLL